MTFGKYLTLMILSTVLSCATFAIVLFSVDPTNATWIGFGLFYATLALSLIGIFAVFGLIMRVYALRRDVVFRQVLVSFRQGVSLAILVTGLLLLQSHGFLTWWTSLLFVLALTVLEFFYISVSKPPREQASTE